MKHLPKHILIPSILLAYLICMVWFFGYPAYLKGEMSLAYLLCVGLTTFAIIVSLFFFIRRRERLRREREEDMRKD